MPGELKDRIMRAAHVLKAAGAQEVYLFGSAASGEYDDDSDVDMAVSGLPPEIFYRATGQASCELDRSLDIVDLDEDTLFVRYLREKGKLHRVA